MASIEASIDYTAIGIQPTLSRGYELSFGTSLAKAGCDDGKVIYVSTKSEKFDFLFLRPVATGKLQTIS